MDTKWKLDIGDKIFDDKRNLVILDRKIILKKRKSKQSKVGFVYSNTKWYRYECNKCGYNNGWMDEKNLINLHQGCSCCAGKVIINGINDMSTTRPDLINYLANKQDACLYTQSSGKQVTFKCPECGNEKKLTIFQVANKGFSCSKCSDGISYPEKFVIEILTQLGISFKSQLSKSDFKWCGESRYDVFLNDNNVILELNGGQHYKDGTGMYKKTCLEQTEIDKLKKSKAIDNGISKYLTIDCRVSSLPYIKKSIMESDVPLILNFIESDIDWNACEVKATKSILKEVCKTWEKDMEQTTIDVANSYGIARTTVIKYLKKGNALGFCNYNPKQEMANACRRNGKSLGKKIEVKKYGISYGLFNSISDLERKSGEIFGIKFYKSIISTNCRKNKLYHGYEIIPIEKEG